MKAGVFLSVNNVNDRTVADPKLEAGDRLQKVKAATVCGTDIRKMRSTKTTGIRYPSVLGHAFAGIVADSGVTKNLRLAKPFVFVLSLLEAIATIEFVEQKTDAVT